jgi:glyoxylase-like metal-dependent hydrolase (beta-lactamase superfamily II)
MAYSMWMLEYSHCLTQPMGCIFYGAWNAGTRAFSYSYVYIEGNGHKILVDIGHDNNSSNLHYNEINDITDYQYPDAVLAKVGARPEEIDTVILTHAHYDHAGAMRWFPNATFYLQRRELETSRAALEASPLFDSLIGALDPSDISELERLAAEGRLDLLDGPLELFPGLEIKTAWDTHTKGGQYAVLSDHVGNPWVITGDAMYSYGNAEGINGEGGYVNIGFGGGSGWEGLLLIDELVKTAGDTSRLVIVHESETFKRNPSQLFDDGLSVAELVLAPGEASRITAAETR